MIFEQKISAEIFHQKYMINGEQTPIEAIRGIAQEIASVEKTKAKKALSLPTLFSLPINWTH